MNQGKPCVAFFGTGLMGRPMASRLLAAGFPVRVWNRTLDKALPLARQGAVVVSSPAEALSGASLLVLMLADKAAIDQALERAGLLEQLAGKTVLQMGTIGPGESRQLAQQLQQAGAQYVEAPVLGSVREAEAGELIVMVGGDRALFQELKPFLGCFARELRYVGPIGQAAALKLALNQLIAALNVAYATSLRLVERAGVDVVLFVQIVRQSALYAPTFDRKLPAMRERRFTPVNFPARHMLKDVRLVSALAQELGLDTGVLRATEKLFAETVAAGFAEADYAAVSLAVSRDLEAGQDPVPGKR